MYSRPSHLIPPSHRCDHHHHHHHRSWRMKEKWAENNHRTGVIAPPFCDIWMTWQKTRASAQFFVASIFIPVAKIAKEGRKRGYRLFGRSLSDRLENWLTVPLLLAKNTSTTPSPFPFYPPPPNSITQPRNLIFYRYRFLLLYPSTTATTTTTTTTTSRFNWRHKITHSRISINATRTLQQTFLPSFPSLNTRFVLLWSSELLASRSCVALLCISVFLAVRHVSSSSPSSHCFIHSLDGQIDM